MNERPRRNRKNKFIRSLIQENQVTVNDLIMPMFVHDKNSDDKIESMPGQKRLSIKSLLNEVGELHQLGIKAIALFPALEENKKSPEALEALNEKGLYPTAINEIKKAYPSMQVMSDIALDPYSSDGHDGLVKNGEILNDETLPILAEMAVVHAGAGADIVGPSDMMDGRVGQIRKSLDESHFKEVSIMSYCVKYASSFYGPFRDALDSAPKAGDKKSYQMDYANSKDVLREARLDTAEGADILMVKPGLSYLDIISKLSFQSDLPIAAYNVSGEYAMIKAASEKGWIDEAACVLEMMTSFKRAGASIILTYFAKDVARYLRESN